jgi:hypothetical protein
VDSVTAQMIRDLVQTKDRAVANEDYDEAKRIKASIDSLQVGGHRWEVCIRHLGVLISPPPITPHLTSVTPITPNHTPHTRHSHYTHINKVFPPFNPPIVSISRPLRTPNIAISMNY